MRVPDRILGVGDGYNQDRPDQKIGERADLLEMSDDPTRSSDFELEDY